MKFFTICAATLVLALFANHVNSQHLGTENTQNSGLWTGVSLHWSAPGDDGSVGSAEEYDIRYSTSYITEENWHRSIAAQFKPKPRDAGTVQQYDISGLNENQVYYFAIKSVDDANNWSAISNIYASPARTYVYTCGDVNDDGLVTIADITFLIGYVYRNGDPPSPIESGNTNASEDSKISMTDIARLISYVFINGDEPVCP